MLFRPKLIQTHAVNSVDLIILVGCSHPLFLNLVTSQMGTGGDETLHTGLWKPSSSREITRHHGWSMVHTECFTSELGVFLRLSALPGLRQSLSLLVQRSQLPDQELVWAESWQFATC